MKGKFKIICAILFLAVAITAGVFINLDRRNDVDWIEAANVAGEEFSFADENNIIMSVEKVLVKAPSNPHKSEYSREDCFKDFTTPLYTSEAADEGTETKKMLIRDEDGTKPAYYYVDVPNSESEHTNDKKYVVFNNEYVKLNNVKSDDGYYIQTSEQYYEKTEGETKQVEMAEAVMVSLGQYFRYSYTADGNATPTDAIGLAGQKDNYYKGEDGSVTDDNFGANLTHIEITAFHNGQKIDNDILPALRNYGTSFRDFVWIIPQVDGGDGLYSFNFKYMYNNQLYTTNFSFYLLFNTDYEGTVSDGNGEYNLKPSLSGAQLAGGSGSIAYQYFLGKDEATVADGVVEYNGYPTLTFDYTKYAFSYSMTANGVTTNYSYSFAINGNDLSRTAMYNCFVNGSSSPISYPLGNYISVGSNIVVFVFTEMGDYTFNFEYIYSGYGANSAPSMNLPIDGMQLSIHGFELNYSATVSAKAQMRHLTLAKLAPTQEYESKINVGLIVPNGYEYGKTSAGENLGVVYTLCQSKDENPAAETEVGSLIGYEGADSIGWGNKLTESGETSEDVKVDDYIQVKKTGEEDDDNDKYVDFVKTNQGAILLNTNDTYGDSKSFYFYATLKKDLASSTAENYSNQTAFSRIGFYLVFINVHIESLNGKADYYQIFAFEYTADTTSVSLKEVENGLAGKEIGSDGYTNKNVEISWAEPGIFERKISVNYYRVLGQYYFKDELLNTSKISCTTNPTVVGDEINNIQSGSKGAKYLVELICENKSTIYTTFTIDRDAITGITPYLVERSVNLVGNTIYRFARKQNGEFYSLANDVITNTVATLYWDNKKSGAKTFASYSLTPLSYKELSVSEISVGSNANNWYTTKYALGETIEDLHFERASDLGASLDSQKILTTQGIYLFTISDEAGNSMKYLFVIDQTEGYFKIEQLGADGQVNREIEPQFSTGESLLFTNDIKISFGTHKAIALQSSNEKLNATLENITNSIASLDSGSYYSQNSAYLTALKSLFAKHNNGYYLTVQNQYVHVYNDTKTHIQTISLPNSSLTLYHGNGASTVRLLYMVGKNQTYLKEIAPQNAQNNYAQISSSNNYLMVEINTDHSLGMAFYANSENVLIPNNVNENGAPEQGLTRLYYTGAKGSEFDGLHATSGTYLAFTWLIGTGTKYEIGEVSYQFYDLDLTGLEAGASKQEFVENGYYYFVNKTTTPQTLYSNSGYSAGVLNNGTRAMAILNIENSQTKAGLYVVTRKYSKDLTDGEGELDVKELAYYFIVDRNEIIASGVAGRNINGGSISVGLKDNEVTFNQFNTISSGEPYTLTYADPITNADLQISYNLYLETNRLPAVLNIPIGKYFYEENEQGFGSEYFAGKLNFSVYFKDVYGQLPTSSSDVVKLFESVVTADDENYYSLDFSANLNVEQRARFIYTDNSTGITNDKDWLCLPGDYVVVISDNVEGTAHQKTIGFRVFGDEDSLPSTDIYATNDKAAENTLQLPSNETKTLVTNDEFVVIDLFNGNTNINRAQLDLDYLLVEQIYNGVHSTYIEYRHNHISGHNINQPEDEPGSVNLLWERDGEKTSHRKILLDTMLVRNADGSIDLSSINNTLEYRITVRYNVSTTTDIDRYKNCYYYYVGDERFACFENTYTVVIDRTPPKENLEFLESQDTLISYYMDEGEQTLFETKDYTGANTLDFVNRYKKYYQSNNNENIYALYVNSTTPFDNSDVQSVRTRTIPSPNSIRLNWPVDNSLYRYNLLADSSDINLTYADFCSTAGFYEILEQDLAGNTTQYVIFYDDSSNGSYDNLNVHFNANKYADYVDGKLVTMSVPQTLSVANSDTEMLTIFDIFVVEDGESFTNDGQTISSSVDRFYRFELNRPDGTTLHAINTTFATSFDADFARKLIDEIIKAEGAGNYNLVLKSRTNTKIYNLNYYTDTEVANLNIRKIIVHEGEGDDYEFLYLDLAAANIPDDGIVYYAAEIRLKDQNENEITYFYGISNDNPTSCYYYLINPSLGDVENNRNYVNENRIYKEALSGTYTLTVIDVFGREQTTSFSTEHGSMHYILFGGENESENHFEYNLVYYSYNQARIIFENSLYSSIKVSYSVNNGTWTNYTLTETNNNIVYGVQNATIIELANLNNGRSCVYIYPFFSQDKLSGATIHAIVTLDGVDGGSYEVVVDTDIGAVSLRNINSQESAIKADVNADPSTTQPIADYAGIMNLIWSLPRSKNVEPYKYRYSLQETMKDGTVNTIDFEDGTFSHIINTTNESTGVYRFIVGIYTNDEQALYLGNKVYTFSVQTSVDELFYVSVGGNRAIEQNSQFNFSEISSAISSYSQMIQTSLGEAYQTLMSYPYNYPLYIVKVPEINTLTPATSVHTADGTNLQTASWSTTWAENNYAFYIYRLYTSTYSFYLGVLEVKETNNVVYNLQINDENLNTALNLNYTVSDAEKYVLKGFQNSVNGLSDNTVVNKNSVLISVYCNGEFLEQFNTNSSAGAQFEYEIKGNGQYSFEFADVAGNVQVFTVTTNFATSQSSRLNIYVLREIGLLVNGANAVDNAYYNGTVEVQLINPALYDTGSITLYSCKLNGVDYTPEIDQYNQVYTFTGFGSYKIEFRAQHGEQLLKKVLVFAIVNVNEYSNSFDLTNIFKYRVDTILNNAGQDITNELLSILKSNESKNQYLLTYQILLDNPDLGTSFGAQKITIIYSVDDGIYPVRELRFAFTLNNQIPTIDCNIKPGESTKKSFTITYNTKAIYEQVGESSLYINDILVAEINEESATNGEMQTYTVSFKSNGAGDYYVVLRGSSGAVHTGFVVTIKEPLNASSIIIIVVVVLVVGTVVGIIIFLRTRMKIR